jgi:arsenate reductase
MTRTKIYHNPRCSKSREALSLLQERGVEAQVIRYLEYPPTMDELRQVVRMLDLAPIDVIRTKEKRFKELGLSKTDGRSDDEWLRIIVDNPVLLERPIVVSGRKAALGRPPEAVLEIL